jgi:hypothetical protein
MKYTVFEHTERGTRFFTSYCPEDDTEGLKIVKHVETTEEAQAICREREKLNWGYFWSDMIDTISGK